MLIHPETQAAKGNRGTEEFAPYFAGTCSLEETVAQIKQQSRRYAKRQLTWFQNRLAPRWVDLVQHPEDVSSIEKAIDQWFGGEGMDTRTRNPCWRRNKNGIIRPLRPQ